MDDDFQESIGMSKILSALGQDVFTFLTPRLEKISMHNHQVLFSPEKPDYFGVGLFVVVSGCLEIRCSGDKTGELMRFEAGDGFGLNFILSMNSPTSVDPRLFCISVAADTTVLLLRTSTLKECIAKRPDQFESFLRTVCAQEWRVATYIIQDFLELPSNEVTNITIEMQLYNEIKEDPLVLESEELTLLQGQILFEEGDSSDEFFVLLEGSVLCSKDSHYTVELKAPGIIGAVDHFTSTARNETITALEICSLYRFDKDTFNLWKKNSPQSALEILKTISQRMSSVCDAFFTLGLQRLWINGGHQIFSQKDDEDSLFVVISGRVRILWKSPPANFLEDGKSAFSFKSPFISTDSELDSLDVSQGETFGESSIVENKGHRKRDCSAVAIRDSQLVRISSSSFKRLFKLHPQIMLRFSQHIHQRYQQIMSPKRTRGFSTGSGIKIISLLPSGKSTTSLHLHSSALRIEKAMKSLSSGYASTVLRLNSRTLDKIRGYPVSQRLHLLSEITMLSTWLSEQEEIYQFIILETDCRNFDSGDGDGSLMTEWDRFCIRQADCLLYIGWNNSKFQENVPVNQSKLEKQINNQVYSASHSGVDPMRYLILLHASTCQRPRGSKQWLKNRKVHAILHVRVDFNSDWQRIGRVLSGKCIGLVLGGGGARGLAHLGAIKALEELGIPIDVIGGTSQGSFMGALYAIRQNYELMKVFTREFALAFSPLNFFLSLTLPLLSYFDGKKFTAAVRRSLGYEDIDIEDFWIPYFCITTNVSQSSMCIHRSGTAWKYIRASMSIFGLIPPIVEGDDNLLIDGGYVNNLAVDVMHELPVRPSTIIAVDVENRSTDVFSNLHDLGEGVSGWWLLWAKLNPFQKKKVPAFGDMIVWLNCISHVRQLRQMEKSLVDVYVLPDIHNYTLFDYHKLDEIAEKGYRRTKEVAKAWLKQVEAESIDVSQSTQGIRRVPTGRKRSDSLPLVHLVKSVPRELLDLDPKRLKSPTFLRRDSITRC